MSIERVTSNDVEYLLNIANLAVRETVEAPTHAKSKIFEDISNNIKQWCSKDNCAFLKYSNNGVILGFILIKEYWNLSDIFILPKYQCQGIGRNLVENAIDICKKQKEILSIRVNSSKNAKSFYLKLGFKEIHDHKSLPYEMTHYEYSSNK